MKTPGVCVHRDAGREVAARIARSDLLVYLTPMTFGGYSSELKKALDHVIPILLPDLRLRRRHTAPARYDVSHNLLAVGSRPPGADGAAAQTFRRLVLRNALNMLPPRWAAGVVNGGADDREVRVAVNALLAEVAGAPSLEEVAS